MLTLFQLQHLPLNEQAQYVGDNGEFYATRIDSYSSVNMYWMGSFWAEVMYNDETNTIVEVSFIETSMDGYV